MKTDRLEVKSPYLARKMTDVISRTGLSIQEMSDKTGLSYGYMRRIVNGTVLPNRDALKRLCDGLGLDFAVEWKATHPLLQQPVESVIPPSFLHETSDDLSRPGEHEAAHDVMRKRMNQIMDLLPIEGMLEYLELGWKLSNKYRDDPNAKEEVWAPAANSTEG